MDKMQKQVQEFHSVFGLPINVCPQFPSPKTQQLRLDLIYEELGELRKAVVIEDLAGVADALGDLLYVIHGAALCFGIDMEPVFDEIHRSNMTKLEGGKVVRREDGKILKGSKYEPPLIDAILRQQALAQTK